MTMPPQGAAGAEDKHSARTSGNEADGRAQSPSAGDVSRTVLPVVVAVSAIHMLNDSMQAVIPAVLPALKLSLALSYTQLGFILFALNMTSSVLQPLIGLFSDKRPSPLLLPIGMTLSLFGIVGIAFAPNYLLLLVSVVFVGFGSAIFHPEGSKVVYLSAGRRRGLAQSIYQFGGNGGSSVQPLMTRYIFLPFGQAAALWFVIVGALAAALAWIVSRWYKGNLHAHGGAEPGRRKADRTLHAPSSSSPGGTARYVWIGMAVLILLTFARSTYHTAILNYYQYFYAETYGATLERAQLPLFVFGVCGVAGTLLGGPLADRFGPKRVIFGSMAGASPLALLLPFAGEAWVLPIAALTGFVLMLGFSVVVVYAQLLMPNHIGTASGLIVGLAFGMGALGAVALGYCIDAFGLKPVFVAGSLLPLLGILTFKLPDLSGNPP